MLAREAHHRGVDLVDAHLVARPREARERAGAEPRDAEDERVGAAREARRHLGVGGPGAVVRDAAVDGSVGTAPLGSVQGGAVMEGTQSAGLHHAVHAEEGALEGDVIVAGGARNQGRDEEYRRQRAREQGGPRPQDEQGRRGERDQRRASSERDRRQAVDPGAAGAAEHRGESGDHHPERDGGGGVVPAAEAHARCGKEGRDRREGDRILVDVAEDHRGHEGDEHPADEPAGRDQEVEAGEVGGGRAQPGQRPVAVERGKGEDEEVDQAEREHGAVGEVQDHQRDQGRGQEAGEEAVCGTRDRRAKAWTKVAR